jgi:hypothetical protein
VKLNDGETAGIKDNKLTPLSTPPQRHTECAEVKFEAF